MSVEIKVWDGSSQTRTDLSSIKNPDHGDYVRIVTELQKLQAAFLNTLQNIELIPNLQGEFDKALEAIVAVQEKIKKLTPPPTLNEKIQNLEQALADQNPKKDLTSLRQDIVALKLQCDKNQLQVLRLQEAFATQVTGFQNRVWNTIKALEKDLKERLEIAEKKLESVSIGTSIRKLLEELNTNETRNQ